jgi:TM2 domain-containing membrane protein YozV
MANIMQIMPYLNGDEMVYVQGLMKDLDDNQAQQFANVYSYRRKDPQTVLLTCLLGFVGVAGVHRVLLNQIGMGILYFLTAGVCFIGTIIDLINYQRLAFEYNQRQAQQVAIMVKGTM